MLEAYGLNNCDTCRKARSWASEQRIELVWHDLKKEALQESLLNAALKQLGATALINRRGTTWRKLTEDDKALAQTDEGCLLLLQAQPSLMKRPLWVGRSGMAVGFADPSAVLALVD